MTFGQIYVILYQALDSVPTDYRAQNAISLQLSGN